VTAAALPHLSGLGAFAIGPKCGSHQPGPKIRCPHHICAPSAKLIVLGRWEPAHCPSRGRCAQSFLVYESSFSSYIGYLPLEASSRGAFSSDSASRRPPCHQPRPFAPHDRNMKSDEPTFCRSSGCPAAWQGNTDNSTKRRSHLKCLLDRRFRSQQDEQSTSDPGLQCVCQRKVQTLAEDGGDHGHSGDRALASHRNKRQTRNRGIGSMRIAEFREANRSSLRSAPIRCRCIARYCEVPSRNRIGFRNLVRASDDLARFVGALFNHQSNIRPQKCSEVVLVSHSEMPRSELDTSSHCSAS
jgi:hypothetical protein